MCLLKKALGLISLLIASVAYAWVESYDKFMDSVSVVVFGFKGDGTVNFNKYLLFVPDLWW